MEGEEEWVEVVREALHEAVHWMEGVAGEGGGDLPYMVGFMKQLVDTTNAYIFSFTHFHTNSHFDFNPVKPGTRGLTL